MSIELFEALLKLCVSDYDFDQITCLNQSGHTLGIESLLKSGSECGGLSHLAFDYWLKRLNA
jgi:hypothetical protein